MRCDFDEFDENAFFSVSVVRELIDKPHLLGHLIGKDKLLPLHSEWIKYCWDADEPRALQAFRGGYKTTAVDVVGIVRHLLVHPDDRIAIIRKSYEDACTIVKTVKTAFELPEVRRLFKFATGCACRALMSQKGRLSFDFKKTATPEANLTAFGLDSTITGFHFDKVICDDIITLRDRISKAEREKTKEVVRELSANIIEPGKGSIWVGTPWHSDDAWRVINSFADVAKYPLSEFGFLGDADVAMKRAATTPFLFAANYELEIRKDDKALFGEPTYARGWDYNKKSVCHIDAGYGGGDYCALTFLSPLDTMDCRTAQSFQAVGFCYDGNVKDWIGDIIRYYKRYRASAIWLETNADKGFLADVLKSEGLKVRTYHEKQNKDVKISTYLYEYWQKLQWSPNTDEEYMNMILDYCPSVNQQDDCPDSCASLIRETCKAGDRAKYGGLYAM